MAVNVTFIDLKSSFTFLQNGHVDFENIITRLSFMLCSMRSLTGAILFGSSGDGVRARLKFDTATPMMKIIEEQQDRVKNQPLY